MTTTTEYGYWANHDKSHSAVKDTVLDFLGDQADTFDVDGLVMAYTDAINEALPDGIALRGYNFYGPYPHIDGYFEAIDEAIESVDLGELAQQYERIELWPIEQVAEHWGVSTSRARHILADAGVKSGYDPDVVKAIPRPGQGARLDLKRRA
jgi:hypothetical protein